MFFRATVNQYYLSQTCYKRGKRRTLLFLSFYTLRLMKLDVTKSKFLKKTENLHYCRFLFKVYR